MNEQAALVAQNVLRRIRSTGFCFICLAILPIIALGDYIASGLSRRTIVFYSIEDGSPLVEERYVARSGDAAGRIRAFVEEALLGPSEWEAAPLVDRTATLQSLFLRDGIAYIDFSSGAALPQENRALAGGPVHNLASLERDIKRNFPAVRGVCFFIEGDNLKLLF